MFCANFFNEKKNIGKKLDPGFEPGNNGQWQVCPAT